MESGSSMLRAVAKHFAAMEQTCSNQVSTKIMENIGNAVDSVVDPAHLADQDCPICREPMQKWVHGMTNWNRNHIATRVNCQGRHVFGGECLWTVCTVNPDPKTAI